MNVWDLQVNPNYAQEAADIGINKQNDFTRRLKLYTGLANALKKQYAGVTPGSAQYKMDTRVRENMPILSTQQAVHPGLDSTFGVRKFMEQQGVDKALQWKNDAGGKTHVYLGDVEVPYLNMLNNRTYATRDVLEEVLRRYYATQQAKERR